MQKSLLPQRRAWLVTCVVLFALLGILLAMGRPPICTCGTVKLWQGAVQSAENSQHITDWYSASHLIHGLLFYFFGWVLWTRWRVFGGRPARYALPIAVAFEGFWEILENSPMIIQRYRETTISLGYVGDSIVNSMSDVGWMLMGFSLVSRLPLWVSIALAIGLELLTLILIRDNLTLNVLMLLWPLESVREWQALA